MIERDVTRERFLAAIAEKVNVASIAEAHFFQPMKQGGTESGVAVVAVSEELHPTAGEGTNETEIGSTEQQALTAGEAAAINEGQPPTAGEAGAENVPAARGAAAENSRLAVYTAKYRLTLKGPERGKWDFAMQAEADAPLVTVDKVVRGVQRRSGDADEPERLSGEDFRALLPARDALHESTG